MAGKKNEKRGMYDKEKHSICVVIFHSNNWM